MRLITTGTLRYINAGIIFSNNPCYIITNCYYKQRNDGTLISAPTDISSNMCGTLTAETWTTHNITATALPSILDSKPITIHHSTIGVDCTMIATGFEIC